LEQLLHPWVDRARERAMSAAADDPQVLAFIWDTPLLFETGLNRQCDAVVFVETARALRLERLRTSRGWDAAELDRREKSQWPLDKKREMSDYVVVNTADADDDVRSQVRETLSRILAK
jgi:dephospho-CoA kinase